MVCFGVLKKVRENVRNTGKDGGFLERKKGNPDCGWFNFVFNEQEFAC